MKRLLLLFLLLVSIPSLSQTRQPEKYYQMEFADLMDGWTEVTLSDNTRVDVMTTTHSIEVDFAEKWAESIGQALHYEGMTGKQAGVLLIVKGKEENRFVKRLVTVAAKHGIDVWIWDYLNNTCTKIEYKIDFIY
jgi:hypothetical protein